MKKFCVIDVDSGNINSIIRMGEEAGFDIDKVSDAKLLADYDVVLLPGIGRYDSFLGNIKEKGFLNFLSDKSNFQDRYLIGFCLGMQVLVNGSQEGSLQGLGLIDGNVIKFTKENLKIPNIGWQYVYKNQNVQLIDHLSTNDRFYFCHSFHVQCKDENVICKTNYGYEFPSGIHCQTHKIAGFQFHPEKSHNFGLNLCKQIYHAV